MFTFYTSCKQRLTEVPLLVPGPEVGGPGVGWRNVARKSMGRGLGCNWGAGGAPAVEFRPGPGSLARGGRAGGHYLLRRAPLRRRRARPGPGPRGAGSGSRAAGKDPRAPQTNRDSRWPGRSRWSVAWSVPWGGPSPEPPTSPGPSLASRSPPPALHRPRRRHLAPRPPEAPGRCRKAPGKRLSTACPIRNS